MNYKSPRTRNLSFNMATRFYEITENDILYQMHPEEMRLLKLSGTSVHLWYLSLDSETKKKVVRTGNFSKGNDAVYRDESFEE